jgi:hypothetical protein
LEYNKRDINYFNNLYFFKMLRIGAYDQETGEYVMPENAVKQKNYLCPIVGCDEWVFLKAGDINAHHFCHYSQFRETKINSHKCEGNSIMSSGGGIETEQHFNAKHGLANYLRKGFTIKIIKNHECGCESERSTLTINKSQEVKVEYTIPLSFKDSGRRADIAIIDELKPNKSNLQCYIEIYHTHRTKPYFNLSWREFDATEVNQQLQLNINNIILNDLNLKLGYCPTCDIVNPILDFGEYKGFRLKEIKDIKYIVRYLAGYDVIEDVDEKPIISIRPRINARKYISLSLEEMSQHFIDGKCYRCFKSLKHEK